MSAASESIDHGGATIARPESISDAIWSGFYVLGNSVADFVMDAFDVYATGDFASWDKNRVKNITKRMGEVKGRTKIKWRNRVCEHILVEKMKKKDFFCCDLCSMTLFNYKQALIHFTSTEHCEKETAIVRDSGIDGVRRVLETFTKLPAKLAEDDATKEQDRRARSAMYNLERPTQKRFNDPDKKYVDNVAYVWKLHEATAELVNGAKNEAGLKLMADLHKFIEKGQFGNRDDFYGHMLSYEHIKGATEAYKEMKEQDTEHRGFFDSTTIIVNVHKKDLA